MCFRLSRSKENKCKLLFFLSYWLIFSWFSLHLHKNQSSLGPAVMPADAHCPPRWPNAWRCSFVLQKNENESLLPNEDVLMQGGSRFARNSGKRANCFPAIPSLKMSSVCAHKSLLMWACLHTCVYELGWMLLLSLRESAVITQWRFPWGCCSSHLALRHIPSFLLYFGFDRKTAVCVLTGSVHVHQHNH